jgi:hypothetical protein
MGPWNPVDVVPVPSTVLEKMIGFGMLRSSNIAQESQIGTAWFDQLFKGQFVEIHKEIARVLKTERRHGDTMPSGFSPSIL